MKQDSGRTRLSRREPVSERRKEGEGKCAWSWEGMGDRWKKVE